MNIYGTQSLVFPRRAASLSVEGLAILDIPKVNLSPIRAFNYRSQLFTTTFSMLHGPKLCSIPVIPYRRPGEENPCF
ncbi:MAG: hypothetical protein JSV16_15675 [Candidatus Hydrogenedentota bacterium]|nr:MAG: hypothetical protein JSV16_15675 [Candidatus Hydrogenedentota bacterium]